MIGFDVCNECYFTAKDPKRSKKLDGLKDLINVIRKVRDYRGAIRMRTTLASQGARARVLSLSCPSVLLLC